MHILFSEIGLAFILGLLVLYFRLRVKRLKTYHSPLTGTIIVWEKYNKERLLTTNGFSQGVTIGDRSISKSYWYFQAEQIVKHCKNKKAPTILWLGLGAGTGPRLVAKESPNIMQLAIEFDPMIVKAASEYFSLNSISNLTVIQNDAYKEIGNLTKQKKTFDAIVVDIYTDDDPGNGKRSSGNDFLGNVSKLLKSDGILIFNRLAHKVEEKERTRQIIKHLEVSFKTVNSSFIKDSRGYQNEVIIASGKK